MALERRRVRWLDLRDPLALGLRAALALGLALGTGACKRASPAERERAAIEGRNLHGSSAPARDDRIPPFEPAPGRRPERPTRPGLVPDSFAYASATAGLVAGIITMLARPRSSAGSAPSSGSGSAELASLAAVLAASPSATLQLALAPVPADPGGLHLRLTVDPALAEPLLAWLREDVEPGAATCRDLDPAAQWCALGPGRLALARVDSSGQVLGQILAGDRSASVPASRVAAATARVSEAAPAELEGASGQGIAWFDAPAWAAWIRAGQGPAAGPDPLAGLWTEARVFDGAVLELDLRDADLLGRLRWRVRPEARATLPERFALDPVDADVPTLAGLCAGARVCARSRGLWNPARLLDLATGPYADPLALLAAVEAEPELAATVLVLATWPNLLASLAGWPGRGAEPSEVWIYDEITQLSGRVLGFGLAVRATGTVAYARVSGADLGSLRSYLGLAGVAFTSTFLEPVPGRVEVAASPSLPSSWSPWSLPNRLYTRFDPGDAWGWVVAADDDADLAWLAGLAHDDGAVPILYVELADLGDALELAWLPALAVRAQLSATEARAPELRFVLERRDRSEG